MARFFSSVMSVVIRTEVPPFNAVEALQRQARSATGDQTIYEVRTMEQLVSSSLATQKFLLTLFSIFSGLALFLACVGIYSVIAYLTNQRVPEFGVRFALGARASDIVKLVLGESLVIICAGTGIGLVSSIAAGRILETLVPNAHTPRGPIFAVVLPALIAVALFAAYIPARRAAKVDPIVALRYE
jgi:ABC-type antimicrobial peptide transport system permease subunit